MLFCVWSPVYVKLVLGVCVILLSVGWILAPRRCPTEISASPQRFCDSNPQRVLLRRSTAHSRTFPHSRRFWKWNQFLQPWVEERLWGETQRINLTQHLHSTKQQVCKNKLSFNLIILFLYLDRCRWDFQEKEERWTCFPSEICIYQKDRNLKQAASQLKLGLCAFYSATQRH